MDVRKTNRKTVRKTNRKTVRKKLIVVVFGFAARFTLLRAPASQGSRVTRLKVALGSYMPTGKQNHTQEPTSPRPLRMGRSPGRRGATRILHPMNSMGLK